MFPASIPDTHALVNPHAATWMCAFQAIDDVFVADCAALRAKYPRRHRKGDPHRDAYLAELADIQARYQADIDSLDADVYGSQERVA